MTETKVERDSRTGWSVDRAAELYHIDGWSEGYFAVNEDGHIVVRPGASAVHEIDLLEVVEGLRERGLSTPLVLRFPEILAHRMGRLHDAFAAAIQENSFRGRYLAVYPVKVNQQRPVVEEIYRFGRRYGYGLEVGSKPELLAVMALAGDEPERPIICNGFKDTGYIEATVLASKLGRQMIPVVENLSELELILEHSRRYRVRPQIGVRLKLATRGEGRWRDSAGGRSKFGLVASQMLEMLEVLRREEMSDCLQLLHCHAGSQIQDIAYFKEALSEVTRVYVELSRLGAGLRYLDVGGGLGVDYLGSRSNVESSMNYSLEEYASDVVYRIASACDDAGVDHPTILSESGRALVAFNSVLVFDVVGSTGLDRWAKPGPLAEECAGQKEVPQPILDLYDACEGEAPEHVREAYHDAHRAHAEAIQLFNLGYLGLELRGLADRLYWSVCAKARDRIRRLALPPEEIEELEIELSETYFCNFSIFQSLPDSWAIEQLFPVLPIHRLGEQPTIQAVLGDLTCDSDGRLDRFVYPTQIRRTLDLHPLLPEEPYYLAAFLVGAYQETLGDLHNLFGDTHVAHIHLDEGNGWWIDEVVRGDTARDVLRYVQYEVDRLQPRLARDCELAIRAGRMSLAESRALLRFYEAELNGYTYLEPD